MAANSGTGGGAIELCPKNGENLLPIHLSIARGHFFIVQHLLSLEQVVLYLMLMPYELYQCLKYAISNRSIQILKMIYQVFTMQIDDPVINKTQMCSFWES